MSMYAVKNDEGEFAHIDMDELTWETGFATLWFGVNEPYAKRTASDYGGTVVELVEKPEQVVVSKAEAEMLEWNRSMLGEAKPAANISGYIAGHNRDYGSHNSALDEDRLMRAYVNGYTVAKEKRYQLKVPYADGWIFQKYSPESKLKHHNRSDTFPVRDTGLIGRQLELTWFTAVEIEHYGLQDCKRVEVKQDEN